MSWMNPWMKSGLEIAGVTLLLTQFNTKTTQIEQRIRAALCSMFQSRWASIQEEQ